MYKHSKPILLLACGMLLLAACVKLPVAIEDTGAGNDPDVVYIDDYQVELSTYKLDSIVTSGHQVFMLGTHRDSLFSKISANSYAEIELPASNPIKSKDVLFDSLVLVLAPNGNYYGDTLQPLKLSVHELTENIDNDDDNNNQYYYPRSFSHNAVPLAQLTAAIKPRKRSEITVRLPDAMGLDWMMKLKRNDNEIQSQSDFRSFFKGICIKTDSLVNTNIFYFTGTTDRILMRLHYRERGVVTTEKKLDFSFSAAKQFNNIIYNNTQTPFSIFSPYKKQVKSSNVMGDRACLSNNIPAYAKIHFPGLLSLKELYPFIKIVRAELELKPAPGTARYPYRLPEQLQLYISYRDNNFDEAIAAPTGAPQTGNLTIDDLYGVNTGYRFDVTRYVNTLIEEGRFSTKTLLLATGGGIDSESSRLVINGQTGANGIKLKLYVLGL